MYIGCDQAQVRLLEGCSEEEVVERARKGDTCAFEELNRRYRQKILNQLRKLCRDQHEADDIFQDVMMTLYLKLDTFEGKSSLSTWIYRITLNAFLMHERKQRRQQLFFTDQGPFEVPLETLGVNADEEPSAYAEMANGEFQTSLAKAVAELPEGYREVFLLRNQHDLPIKEVSRRLGISVPAVKSRNRRARQFLRTRLEEYHWN